MALQDRIRKLTYDDYVLIPDDGKRHEILDGEHYVSPAPLTWHQYLSIDLGSRLHPFVKARDLGSVFAAPYDVVFSRHDIVQPDLIFIAKERLGIVTEANLQGTPDLVVEILSKRTRRLDEGIKLSRYEHFGVREYWVVNGFRKTVTVYLWIDGTFQRQPELSAAAGDILTTTLLPGLEIPLAELFGV